MSFSEYMKLQAQVMKRLAQKHSISVIEAIGLFAEIFNSKHSHKTLL